MSDFGIERSFQRAAASVKEHYGFEIGASAVRVSTLDHARRAREVLEDEYEEPFRILPAKGQEHVIAQADGSMVCVVEPGQRQSARPRQWKEIKLVVAQAKDSAQGVYGATLGSVAQAGRRWGHCARQAGWGLESEIHVLGDGAGWIRLQSQEVFGSQGVFLCDYYHVGGYLAGAAEVCRPHNPDQWRRTQQRRLKKGKVGEVLKAMAADLEPEGIEEAEAPVRAAHRYLDNRRDCLDYARAIRLGLAIGSGMVESGHRHVIQARLKQPGTAWLATNAESMAQLRVLRANHRWEPFWN